MKKVFAILTTSVANHFSSIGGVAFKVTRCRYPVIALRSRVVSLELVFSAHEYGLETYLVLRPFLFLREVSLNHAVSAFLGPDHGLITYPQAKTMEGISDFVPTIAEIFGTHLLPRLISNKRQTLRTILQYDRQANLENHRELTNRPIKRKAAEAWKEKNYDDVVKIYLQLEGELSIFERSCLAYAKRKMTNQ